MPTSPVESSSPRAPIALACEPGCGGDGAPGGGRPLDALEQRLLDDFQRDFPLVSRPFAEIARILQTTEEQVLRCLESLRERDYVSRVGPVFTPHKIGYSLLATLAVPASDIEQVAELVNSYPEVNHNYEREHVYNLWFVVTGEHVEQVEGVVTDIEARTGLSVLRLPLERAYHIDLGFSLWR